MLTTAAVCLNHIISRKAPLSAVCLILCATVGFIFSRAEALDAIDGRHLFLNLMESNSGIQNLKKATGGSRKLLTSVNAPTQLFELDSGPSNLVDYTETRFGAQVAMTLDQSGSARLKTFAAYGPGTSFKASIKGPEGLTSGVVSTFYASTATGVHDEIDFEFLGNKKSHVQTNFWADGWYIDDNLIRQIPDGKSLASNFTLPSHPMYLYISVWDASDIGEWAGACSYDGSPYVVHYANITVTNLLSGISTLPTFSDPPLEVLSPTSVLSLEFLSATAPTSGKPTRYATAPASDSNIPHTQIIPTIHLASSATKLELFQGMWALALIISFGTIFIGASRG